MKMTRQDFNRLTLRICEFLNKHPDVIHYETSAYKRHGLSAMRYRWDIFHATDPLCIFNRKLSDYLNDNHIDTALRRIIKTK